MSLILHINTATANAHVSMARNGLILQSLYNNLQKDHASFLQVAIKQLVNETGITLTGLDAIAGVIYRIACRYGQRQGFMLCIG